MKILLKFLCLLICLAPLVIKAQEDEEEDYDVVVFSTLMGDVIDNVGQERIDAVDVALASFDNPNTYQPDHLSIPSLYFFKARELTFQGKYEEALEIAQTIKDVSPTIVSSFLPNARQYAYSMGYVTEGFVNWIKKDIPLAKTYYDSALQYFPDGFYANFFLGWIAQNEKENQKAIEYYTKAENGVTVIKFDWAEMYYKKGVVFHGMKLYSQAAEAYTKSIEKFPLCMAFFERGRVYYYSSAYQDKSIAYDDFRDVIANCPNYDKLGQANSFVAVDYHGKRNYQQALKHYKKAYELIGSPFDAAGAGSVYYNLQDWNNSILWRTKAIDAAQKDPRTTKATLGEYYYWRAMSFTGLKRWGNAASDLRKARSLGDRKAADYLNKNAAFFSKY